MVEDNKDLRESIAEYLHRVGYDVTAVGTGLGFFHALSEQSFGVAIIDLGLPDISGLQLVEYVRKNTGMRCIILTACNLIDDRIAGYDSGADLYMVKPVDCRELASALSGMVRRFETSGPATGAPEQWQLDRRNAALITPHGTTLMLTSRELDFLHCLAGSPEKTISRETILNSMRYRNDEFANRALESLIRRLRRKIEGFFGSSPIQTRYGDGYTFSAPITLI